MIIAPYTKSYNGKVVVDTPEIELESNRIYALVGANGSGKTTLARLLSGVERDDKGHTFIEATVGYMPQKSYAFRMSVRANLMLGGSDAARCERLLDALSLSPLAEKPAHKLSGGETARMALARLMMKDYALVILDEPTASMDMESTLSAEKLIVKYCHESGCTVLMVTHSLQQARRIADGMLFLENGILMEKSNTEAFFQTSENDSVKRFLRFYGL